MANDFNASLVISTSEAVNNVRNVDAAAKDLDKTLAHLHTTMQSSQGDIDKVAKSLKVFTDTQRQANKDEKERNNTLITQARLEREQIVNKDKSAQATSRQAQNEAKLAGIRARNGRGSASGLGNETRKNAESEARIINQNVLATARATTESERNAAAQQRTAAAIAQRAGAESRAEQSALRLASAQERSRNANLALNDSLSNSRYLLYDVGATYATLSAILLAIPAATTAVAASYEKDFTQVLRTTGLVGDQAGALYDELKGLGREIPLSFGEFANIASIAGQLGIAKSEIGAFTETVAKFGAASNVATDEAATAFGRLENSFNQAGKIPDFYNRIGSAIAKVGVESAASESEIIAVTNQISAAGAQFGFTADQIVGLSGALASVRIRPELARGAFQRILLGLSSAADKGTASFDQFAKYTHVAGQEAIDLFKTDPSSFFQQYIAGIKGTIASGTSVSAVLDDIGAKNVFDKQFILGLANGLDVYNKAMSDSAGAFKDGTFLNESTKATFETFAATITKIGTAFSTLGADLGKGTLGPLSAMADALLNVINGVDRLVTKVPAVGAIVNGLLAFGAVTGVFLAFKSAQAFVLAGLVGFQQVAGKAAIAGALSLKGNVAELAKTMLMAKGASAQYAGALLANKTAMQQLGTAATTTSAEIKSGAAGSIGVLATTSTTTTSKLGGLVGGLKSVGTSMLGMVGGPIGALVLGLGAVITQLISTQEEAAQAGDAIARSMQSGADAVVRTSAEGLAKIKVAWTDGIAFGNLNKTLVEVAQNAGVSFEKLAAAAAKGAGAGQAVLDVMNEVAQNKGFKDFADLQANSFGSQNHAGELKFLADKVTAVGNESAKASTGLKAVDSAANAAGEAAAGAAGGVETLDEGLAGVEDQARKASDAIGTAVDAIFGLVDAQAATQGALGKLGQGLVDSSNFGTNNDAGRTNLTNFQDVLRSAALEQQQLINSGEQTAQQAATNYTAFINGLLQQLASKGVDVAQVQALANQAKGVFGSTLATGVQPTITPKVEASKVAAEAMSATQVAQTIISQYAPTLKVSADSSEAKTEILRLAYDLATITGWDYNVVVDALTDPASKKGIELANLMTQIVNGKYVAPVGADTSTAIANVQNFASYARTELATLQAQYDSLLQTANEGQGFFKGSANVALGRNWDGSGTLSARPGGAAPAAAAAPAVVMPAAATPPDIPMPDFSGLQNGYNDAAQAAQKAGDAGKKAGEDAANGIDQATQAADDYANRLKQGLQSAFDKQYGMASAADAYHTALNAINKKHEDELSQLADLIAKQKELNNSRKEDLTNARKAGIEKAISNKYGEVDRSADYGRQEQSALDAAAAKQKDIDVNGKAIQSLKDGIGNFKGNTQAAIDNREALRGLESKMLDMIGAYASTGASQDQVRAKAAQLTGQFQRDVQQIVGKSGNRVAVQNLTGDMRRYVATVGSVPRVKPTAVTADTAGASRGIQGIKSALAGIPRNTTTRVTVEKVTKNWVTGGVVPTKDYMKDGSPVYHVVNPDGSGTNLRIYNRGGQVQGFANGGLIPGQAPANPRADNMMAQVDGKGMIKVRSSEFIIQQPAVDYWGLDFFKQLNNMKMPAFNAGGSIGGGRSGSGSGGPVLVELTAENIAAIQRLPQVNLFTENRLIAQSANDGNAILATQGAN